MESLKESRCREVIRCTLAAIALFTCLAIAGCAQSGTEEPAQPQAASQDAAAESHDEPAQAAADTKGIPSPSTAGALRVAGAQLCGQDGSPVQLRGVSTHGLAWYPGYVNRDFFRELRQDWNANVVRLALYTAESGGYCTDGDQAQLYDLVREGVGYAADADLYAIVDWHILSDGNPLTHADEAAAFFERVSADLAGSNNVLYEICNEPNGGTTWADVKAYAERIIPIIRANDPDAVIIVGTPTWSQEVDKAAADPIDAENVMYALHFYAATHQDDLRNRMTTAVQQGLPVFVSEFGICDASGNGAIDEASANAWVAAMDALDVSYVCWNLSNKNEASALFESTCDKTSGFTADDLSAEGIWLRGVLRSESSEGGSTTAEATGTAATNLASPSGNGTSSTADSALRGTTGSLSWTATVADRWTSEGKSFYRYVVTVTNEGDSAIDTWSVQLPLSATVDLSDSWNATVSTSDTAITLESVSYNGSLAPHASAQDIGFIVSSSAPSGIGPVTD